MAKILFLLAFAGFLLAPGHSLIPIDSIINTLGDTVGGLTGSVTGVAGDLVKTVTGLLELVLELLAAVIKALSETLASTLDSVLAAPLNVLNDLLVSVKGLVNSKEIVSGLNSALVPALKSVGELAKLTGTATCLVNTIVSNLTTEILKGVPETVTCAKPIIKEVSAAIKGVEQIVGNSVGIATKTTKKLTMCADGEANLISLSNALSCVFDVVSYGLQTVATLVAETTPVIQDTLSSALTVPQCAQDVLVQKLTTATTHLNSVVECVVSKGYNVTPPQLPHNIPNFSDVANSAFSEIDNITSNAIGPNSKINALLATLKQLKSASDTVSVSSIKVRVFAALRVIQKRINEVGVNPNNLSAIACANDAQAAVNNLGERGAKIIETYVASIAPDAVSLISQTARLNLALNEIALRGAVDILTKCSRLALATDNSAGICFTDGVEDIKNRVDDLEDKIVVAIVTANGFIRKINNNLAVGLQLVKRDLGKISAKLKQCTSG